MENTLNGKEKNIICNIPFDSQRKKSLTAVQMSNGMVRIFVKGAPEFMLEVCSKYMVGEVETADMTAFTKDDIINKVIKDNFAPKALRTILVAYKDISIDEFNNLKHQNNDFSTVEDK